MASKNIVITGANRGLGLEMVKQLLVREEGSSGSSKIYALCRRASDALSSLASSSSERVVVVENVDVSRDDCVPILRTAFNVAGERTPIDLLVHNAGAYGPPEPFASPKDQYASQDLATVTMDRMRGAFELNTLGPLRVTQALLPNLKQSASAKVVIISSLMGSMTDNTSGGHYGYRTAKAGVNMVGKSLAMDLKDDKIAVGMVHPGFVQTGFQGTDPASTPLSPGQHPVDTSAKGVLEAIAAIDMETTGSFLHGNYGLGVKSISW